MIILASNSPRRKEILSSFGYNFLVVSPKIEEMDFKNSNNITDYSANLAKMKAYSVYNDYKNDLIISCDTIVIFEKTLFEKPKDYDDAFYMLKRLSNNTHFVLTSYTILFKDIEISRTVKTFVTFDKLSDDSIKKYLGYNTFLDKAGSYAIQDKNCKFVKNITGSFYNVMGFPIEQIKKDMAKLNYFPNKES